MRRTILFFVLLATITRPGLASTFTTYPTSTEKTKSGSTAKTKSGSTKTKSASTSRKKGTSDTANASTITLNSNGLPVFTGEDAELNNLMPQGFSDIQVSLPANQGVRFSTPDGSTWGALGGYFQTDYSDFGNNDEDTVHHIENFTDGVFLPSARLQAFGLIRNAWRYRFEYDFADKEFKYAFLQYIGAPHVAWTVGEFKPAFSTQSLTDRVDENFMEKALTAEAFDPAESLGTQVLLYSHHFTFAVAAFGPGADGAVNGIPVVGDDPLGISEQISFIPIRENRKLLRFEFGNYTRQAVDFETQFRTIPEMHTNLGDVYLVDTGIIPHSHNYDVASGGVVGSDGSFSFAANYYMDFVNRYDKQPNLTFSGYHITLDYFLTGEARLYNVLDGTYVGISKIRHSYGAWEMSLRYSNIDLDSRNIRGGLENDMSVALNWFPVQRVKFALNYIYADATPSDNGKNRRMNIVGLMAQMRF